MRFNFGFQTIFVWMILIVTHIFTEFNGVGATTKITFDKLPKGRGGGGGGSGRFDSEFFSR